MKKFIEWLRAIFLGKTNTVQVVEEGNEPKIQSSVIPDERKDKEKEEEEDINKTEESEKIEKGDDDDRDDIQTPDEPVRLVVVDVDDLDEKKIDELRDGIKNDRSHQAMVSVKEQINKERRIKENLTSKFTPNVWRDPKTGRYMSRNQKTDSSVS